MRTTGLVFLGLGLIALLVAAVLFGSGAWFRATAEAVQGVVIEEVLTPFSDGNAYCPVIRYTTQGGFSYTHHSNICAWPAAYERGDTVRLYVDPADPEHVQLYSFFSVWFGPLLAAFLGAVFFGVGLTTYRLDPTSRPLFGWLRRLIPPAN